MDSSLYLFDPEFVRHADLQAVVLHELPPCSNPGAGFRQEIPPNSRPQSYMSDLLIVTNSPSHALHDWINSRSGLRTNGDMITNIVSGVDSALLARRWPILNPTLIT